MNHLIHPEEPINETIDFTTTITVICHLMALYALKPCEPLVTNINRHIKVILNASASESLREWAGDFKQILSMWELITKNHAQATQSNSQQITSH